MGRHVNVRRRARQRLAAILAALGLGGAGAYAEAPAASPPPPQPAPEGTPAYGTPTAEATHSAGPSASPTKSPAPTSGHETHSPANHRPWAQTSPSPKTLHVDPTPTQQLKVMRGAPTPTHSATSVPAPVSASRYDRILVFLVAQLGKPYVYGGNGPDGWDCSGLTVAAYERVGIYLPRTAAAQSLRGYSVPLSHVEPGDLLFWGGVGSAYHVAVYIGGGKYIAAENSRMGVIKLRFDYQRPEFARRVM